MVISTFTDTAGLKRLKFMLNQLVESWWCCDEERAHRSVVLVTYYRRAKCLFGLPKCLRTDCRSSS